MTYHKFLLFVTLLLITMSAAVITYFAGKAQVTNQNSSLSEHLSILPSPMPSATLTPTFATHSADQLDPSYKVTLATFFWVGESADTSNGFISNVMSAWDSHWTEHFGGVDDPHNRCGYHPCSFTPKENPFYFALPYNDLDELGNRKASAENIPWFSHRASETSVLKNYWIEVKYLDRTCYAQWQDVGPFESDDFGFVFGDQPQKNTLGVGAGIDISPAVRDCLGMKTNDRVGWKFVNQSSVPAGPWTEIVTTRGVSW